MLLECYKKIVLEMPDVELDEEFENEIVGTNAVYRLVGEELLPYKEYWGKPLRHEILQPNEVLVFDFGSELYVWHGSLVDYSVRQLGMKLARQIWDAGYDYTNCDINPLHPMDGK